MMANDGDVSRPTARLRAKLVAVGLVAALASAPLAADDSTLDEHARHAGRQVGEVVHAVVEGARAVGHEAARIGVAIGRAAAEAGRTIGRAAAEGGRELGRAARGKDKRPPLTGA